MPPAKKAKAAPEAKPVARPPAQPKRKSGAKKPSTSLTPMLDAENDAALGMLCCNHAITSTGAQYNTEILTQSHMVVDQLKTQWPGIAEEDPLPLGQGARTVSWM